MEKKFKQGDVVILKSGGPQMTVKGYKEFYDPKRESTIVECSYFDNNNLRQKAEYEQDMLELA